MSKGTIIYIGGFILPDGNAAAQRVIGLAKGYKDLGYHIVFVDTQHGLEERDVLKTYHQEHGFDVYSVPYPTGVLDWVRNVTSHQSFLKVFEEVSKGGDIKAVIAYNYSSIALARIIKFCQRRTIPVVSDNTEWALGSMKSPSGILKNIDTWLLMTVVQKRLNGIIAISEFLYNYYFKIVPNVVQIPPTVDKSDEKWPKQINSTDHTLKLIYAGSPGNGRKDRLDKIIWSLVQCEQEFKKPIELKIIGITEEQYRESFKMNPEKGIPTFVQFFGRLNHNEVIHHLSQADFSIFIRDTNRVNTAGFPTKFVESVSSSTPVLCNNTSNLSDFIEGEGLGFFIDPSSERSLFDSFKKVFMLSTEEKNSLKERCLESQVFDYQVYMSELERVIS